jgi:uncharacterized protein (DUF1015 family)
MVDIKPFRGYIYNTERGRDISSVIAPPWDVITAEDEGFLRSRSSYNIIRLISGSAEPSDVKKLFSDWIKEKVIVQDKKEVFYFSRCRFRWMGKSFVRTGIFALLHLEDFSSGNVIPHEKVFEKHHKNRYKLIERCRANFSPVFMLYQDRAHLIEKIVDSSTVVSEGKIEDNNHVDFGRISGSEDVSLIKSVLTPCKLIIADGHHRYQAALQFYKDNPDARNSYVLIFLVNIESPELLILPTHRYIPSDVSFIEKKNTFEKYFGVEKVPSANVMFEDMQQEKGTRSFGVYEKGEFYTVRMLGNPSSHWQSLDTVVLHNYILPQIMKTDGDEILYHQSSEHLLKEYRKTNNGVIFFLKPVDKQQFLNICLSGKVMPQKTTYFYPKVPSGLVVHMFEG